MAEAATTPGKTEEKKTEEKATALQVWRPLKSLRREAEQLFDDFGRASGSVAPAARYSISNRFGGAN